jgi:transposase
MSHQVFVGIDVSKDWLDVAKEPSGCQCRVANEQAGLDQLVAWIGDPAGCLVVMEATGGYEMLAAATLSAAGFEVAVANPRQVRQHARSRGQLAKTDKLDAKAIADFAQRNQPVARPLADEQTRLLAALMARRRQLVAMLTMEKNRLQQAPKPLAEPIARHIQFLKTELDQVDDELGDQIRQSDIWREKDEILRSVPGVGEVTSRTLLADLPELGELSNKKIAALAGVAPFNCDSGKFKGQRTIWGGRATVRTALYMAVVSALRFNPVIRLHYQRLKALGKQTKVAMVACMRKLLVILNTMLKERTTWQPKLAQTA